MSTYENKGFLLQKTGRAVALRDWGCGSRLQHVFSGLVFLGWVDIAGNFRYRRISGTMTPPTQKHRFLWVKNTIFGRGRPPLDPPKEGTVFFLLTRQKSHLCGYANQKDRREQEHRWIGGIGGSKKTLGAARRTYSSNELISCCLKVCVLQLLSFVSCFAARVPKIRSALRAAERFGFY